MTASAIVSTDKTKLNIPKIHDFIANQSYWGATRTFERMQTAIDNTICFGVYVGEQQVAFARVLTDHISVAYLMDVIVFTEYQGRGYGKLLIETILDDPAFANVPWLLQTQDAAALYQKFGFDQLEHPEYYLRRPITQSNRSGK